MIQIKTGLKVLFVLTLVLAVHSVVWAQATGSLVGTVTDTIGAAVPTATVTLQNTGTGDMKTAKSGGTGDYQFLQLLPGMYEH
jgi:hypothetical protein